VLFYRGRPVRKCEVMGYVVTVNPRDSKTIFTGAGRPVSSNANPPDRVCPVSTSLAQKNQAHLNSPHLSS